VLLYRYGHVGNCTHAMNVSMFNGILTILVWVA
jgi:hypothetical protein